MTKLPAFALIGGFVLAGGLAANVAFALDVLPKKAPEPKDNPTTEAKVTLGKTLYFDPRLSSNGVVSCNTCHNVMAGGDDNRPVSVGIEGKTGGRSAPTVWNSAFLSVQFWDGRAPSLEEQAKGPLINPVEMGMPDHKSVVDVVKSIPGYAPMFKKAFGGSNPITIDNLAKAIAAYERTLLTPNSPVDLYLQGNKKALSKSAQRGMKLFESVGCVSCHSGPNYAGPALPDGQGFFMRFPTFPGSTYETKYKLLADLGRYEDTKQEAHKHMWRVSGLRNIALTAPYMHNGAVPTLDEAVRVMAKTQLGRDLKNSEVTDLVAFLTGLTGEFPEQTMPHLPGTDGVTVIGE